MIEHTAVTNYCTLFFPFLARSLSFSYSIYSIVIDFFHSLYACLSAATYSWWLWLLYLLHAGNSYTQSACMHKPYKIAQFFFREKEIALWASRSSLSEKIHWCYFDGKEAIAETRRRHKHEWYACLFGNMSISFYSTHRFMCTAISSISAFPSVFLSKKLRNYLRLLFVGITNCHWEKNVELFRSRFFLFTCLCLMFQGTWLFEFVARWDMKYINMIFFPIQKQIVLWNDILWPPLFRFTFKFRSFILFPINSVFCFALSNIIIFVG